jgi:signal recognition particle GTPase
MLIFLNPKQYIIRSVIDDPDGWRQNDQRLEEEYALRILAERKKKAKQKITKRKKSLKQQIEEALIAGATSVEVAESIADDIIKSEPQFVFTEEMKLDVDRIVSEHKRQVIQEVQQMVLDFAARLSESAAILEADYYSKVETKRKRQIRDRAIKALYLFAIMDDEDE